MEQIDQLLNGYKIIQDPQKFQFGIDAVLLSDFAVKGTGFTDKVIDLGTGTGIIPLLMHSKRNSADFTGIEIQKETAQMAGRSIELNNLCNNIHIVNGDIKSISSLFQKHSFNVVTSNPPYMISEHGKNNQEDAKSISRHEILCNLDDIISAADYLLLPHGKFFLIHRPFRLPEIFSTLQKYKLEPKTMCLVHPFLNREPNMVLIEARKNAKSRLKILPPLVVRNDDGSYTNKINEIYGR